MKKYKKNELIGLLGNKKVIRFNLLDKKDDINIITSISIKRLDLINSKKYNKETYLLIVEKHDERFYPGDCEMILDINEKFCSFNELLTYLINNQICKLNDILDI